MKKIPSNTRRQFLKTGAAAALATQLAHTANAKPKDEKNLRVLFLGGTGFIGPHMVRECIEQGHEVTLFNRGKRNTDLFPHLETIIGNRDPEKGEGLKGLRGRSWDAVIDTSGYLPRHVNASAELLADAVSHYLFISTVSVYSDFSIVDMKEDAPLNKLEDPSVEKITGETYGGLKVLCEKAVAKHYDANAMTILRPTYIVGPGDHTDRFIHYINRPMQGGRMALPGKPSNPIKYVDVRDLAEFTERCLSERIIGTFNMVNKPGAANFGELMKMSTKLSDSDVKLTWLDAEFLSDQKKQMGDDYASFPMWHDQDNPEEAGSTSQEAAVKAGFTNRPFSQTVADTHQWWVDQPQARKDKMRALIKPEFEKELLAKWDAR